MNKTEPQSAAKSPVDQSRIQDLIQQLEVAVGRYERVPNDLSDFEGSKGYRRGYLQAIEEVLVMLKRLLN